MLELTLKGTAWDGVYGLDLDTLNGRELHLVKNISGVRLGEMEDALLADDYDLYVAFAAIAIVRDGKVQKEGARLVADSLMEGVAGSLSVDWKKDEGDDAGPPALPPSEPSGSGGSSSTPSDAASGDTQETTLASTGAST